MTPEDTNKIIAAIDRNTRQVKEVAVSGLVRNLILSFMAVIAAQYTACPRAHATPLLPEITYEIGTPPLPPPNPHLQYWHTSYVPGPDGVLPVEVFAPRLVAQVASDAEVVDVPEPGTGLMVTAGFLAILCFLAVGYRGVKDQQKLHRYRAVLREIYWNSDDDVAKQIALKALEEKP